MFGYTKTSHYLDEQLNLYHGISTMVQEGGDLVVSTDLSRYGAVEDKHVETPTLRLPFSDIESVISKEVDDHIKSLGPLDVKVAPYESIPALSSLLDKSLNGLPMSGKRTINGGFVSCAKGFHRFPLVKTIMSPSANGIHLESLIFIKDEDYPMLEDQLKNLLFMSFSGASAEICLRQLSLVEEETPSSYKLAMLQCFTTYFKVDEQFQLVDDEKSAAAERLLENIKEYGVEEVIDCFSVIRKGEYIKAKKKVMLDLNLF
ncbi:hypothetical protein ACQR3P_28980 [Rhodococcus sp. IEGM1300]